MINKFKGTFDELKKVVVKTGLQGEWESEGVKKTFRTWENGVLNWWKSTGTIQFQGKDIARTALEKAVKKAMAKRAITPKRVANEEDDEHDDDYDDDIDMIDDDGDDQVSLSSMPKVGGVSLLNLVKKALVEYGFAVSTLGPSTFRFKGDGGTPSFTLVQEGPVIRIRKQY